jgi:hypothetical protein
MTNLEKTGTSESECPSFLPRRSARLAAKRKKLAEETGESPEKKSISKKTRKIKKTSKRVTRTKKAKNVSKSKKNMSIRDKKLSRKALDNSMVKDSLDLALVCDCTGSMSSWMTRAKETLRSIIHNVLKSHEGLHVRIAFIGYRDFCDGPRQYAVHEFTTQIDKIRNFINSQPATGGGDMPEDVVGGYSKMCDLDWKAETRIAFHICDAPAHGRQYHNDNTTWDTYPKGSPSGISLEQIMQKTVDLGINLTFIKLTKHTDKMFDVMKGVFDSSSTVTLELTDMDQNRLAGVSKEEVDKAFIEKASFIISKKVGKKKKKSASKVPLWTGDIQENSWYSSTNYVKIKSISESEVEVTSTAGGNWKMSVDLLQKMDSADHYDYEIPLAKGELVEMLESTRDTIFTICFRKKVQQKNVVEKLENEGLDFMGDLKKSKKLAKSLLEGEECIIVGKMVNLEPKLGRSMVKDLRVPFGYNLRQVDHRTIEWIIFKNRKFILKKPGKKYPALPEAALKIEDPIHTKWNLDKLSVGNWFSDTKYLRVDSIRSDGLINATTSEGKKLVISDDIIQNEMYSSVHYEEEEKVTRTELAGILEDAGNKVFSATFRKKVNQKAFAERLRDLEMETIDNKRKLNKYVKEMLQGSEIQMTAYLAKSEPKLGRSLVIGLDIEGPNKFRQVDHRGMESIIFKNKRYILK